MNSSSTEDDKPNYEVVETDRFDADREAAFLRLFKTVGPEYANSWIKSLIEFANGVSDFPRAAVSPGGL